MNTAAVSATKKKKKKTSIGLTAKKDVRGYLFILPFLIGITFIFVPALINSFRFAFSFVKIELGNVVVKSVGWDNFMKLQEDITFVPKLLKAIQGIALDLVIITFFSFFIATILNQKFLGRGFARTVFFLPVLLATGIIAAADTGNMAMEFFSSSTNKGGAIASAFTSGSASFFDLKAMLLNTNISRSFVNIIITAIDNTYNIVNSSGVQILIFISALQSIPPSIFEASKVEGATKWEEFWKITFPMMTPMILVNVVYTIVDSFENPKYEVLKYIRQVAFEDDQMGYASALAWIYFAVVLIMLGIVWGVIAKRIQYLD